ncbi:MAG: TIM barrel protein [Bacteroidota bacterium]
MKRRDFMGGIAAATLGATVPGALATPAQAATPAPQSDFKLKYAPHFGMFKHSAGDDLIDQLKFMHEHGFRALEDNGMKNRSIETQEALAQEMGRLGMEMGVFVANSINWREPDLVKNDPETREAFLGNIRDSIEVAKRVNATWMTVVPGHIDLGTEIGYQTAYLVDTLRYAADLLEPHGLVIVLEPLNWWRNHAGQFLNKIPQAYQICRAVNSPAVKILFDIYHQQIHEGNIIPNIDLAWDEVAYFQIGDNPGRKEPTTGEINYLKVFGHIHDKGWTGIMGMEHGNSQPGADGEMAVIEAYRTVDNFG